MEDELKCPVCKNLYQNPVLLPCFHSLCLSCGVSTQQPTSLQQSSHDFNINNIGEFTEEYLELDKLSLVSETDSGVVCNSRPSSYVGTPNIQGIFPPPPQCNSFFLSCVLCQKIVYFDDNGALNLPKNKVLSNIVDKYIENKHLSILCQLCEKDAQEAVVMCEQCEIFYCESCRDSCHPSRGPLAKHNLVSPEDGKIIFRSKNKMKELKCVDHNDESVSMYCVVCKVSVCVVCLQNGRHLSHDVQALGAICKAQKTELSHSLQALSEKAKGATEFIQQLKVMSDKISENCSELEADIENTCALIISKVCARKQELIEFLHKEKDHRIKSLKDEIGSCTSKLQHLTGLLQFSIEALKETDSIAFLQVGCSLIHRVAKLNENYQQEIASMPLVSEKMDFTLDPEPVYHAVENMTFSQMKPPGPPMMIPEDCVTENNRVTVAWQPHSTSFVEGYILELDDGNGGEFREVYLGKETICTMDGLHFNCLYNARVKAYNSTGEGEYSDVISLRTSDVAWFIMDHISAHPDIVLSNDNQTISCDSYEHRVVLGNVGFSRGLHYWEYTVDRYECNADPSFGIARFDVTKDLMLGKDDKGWSMYIDHQRSWFLHNDCHENRIEGGIEVGSVIGIFLDLDHHQISFYVNDEPQGHVAFSNLHGMFFPAISLNRSVQVTVHTALDPPIRTDFTSKLQNNYDTSGILISSVLNGI